MEKEVKGVNFIRVEKSRDKYGYTAYSKPIKVCAQLFDKDSDLVWEEALKAKESYMAIVKEQHEQGIKCKGFEIKVESLLRAESFMREKYGDDVYNDVLFMPKTAKKEQAKVVRKVTGDKDSVVNVKSKEDSKKELKKTTKQVSEEFTNSTNTLENEFDNDADVEMVDVQPVLETEVENEGLIDILDNIEVEVDKPEEKEEEGKDFSIFDLDVPLDDIFGI